ncbi:MAG: hypothetical protein HWD59_01330 [Coxiellaceae bacterium]|nr:MAG: hypothetical protein HWD59_01330 [Coxiellaceae bacterium]
MKRFATILSIGLISTATYAAYPAATNPTEVSVPQLPGGFVVGGTLLYLQPTPTNGDLDYATLTTINPVASGQAFNTSTSVVSLDPSYTFGGGVNVGYIFPGTGNDINLSYIHLNSDDDSTTVNGANQFILPINTAILPVIPFPGLAYSSSSATTSVQYNIDQVDLSFGQFLEVGCRLVLHPFAGARFAAIERKQQNNYVGTVSAPQFDINNNPLLQQTNQKSDFYGVGPLAGLDASYYLWRGIGLVGHFSGALMVGSIDAKQTATQALTLGSFFGETVNLTEDESIETNSSTRIVPAVDAKWGLDYTYLFNNSIDSDLTIEAGYQVSQYFNAIDKVSLLDGATSTSNLGLNGPYISLTIHA